MKKASCTREAAALRKIRKESDALLSQVVAANKKITEATSRLKPHWQGGPSAADRTRVQAMIDHAQRLSDQHGRLHADLMQRYYALAACKGQPLAGTSGRPRRRRRRR